MSYSIIYIYKVTFIYNDLCHKLTIIIIKRKGNNCLTTQPNIDVIFLYYYIPKPRSCPWSMAWGSNKLAPDIFPTSCLTATCGNLLITDIYISDSSNLCLWMVSEKPVDLLDPEFLYEAQYHETNCYLNGHLWSVLCLVFGNLLWYILIRPEQWNLCPEKSWLSQRNFTAALCIMGLTWVFSNALLLEVLILSEHTVFMVSYIDIMMIVKWCHGDVTAICVIIFVVSVTQYTLPVAAFTNMV